MKRFPVPRDLERATRRTWAEVDLDAIAANVAAVRNILDPATTVMAVLKADAYGHGAVSVARAALDGGARWLGVATVGEGLALRAAGIRAPVLVLGAIPPAEVREAVRAGLSLTVTSPDDVPLIASAARARVHLKIDTGMTRLGVLPGDVPAVVNRIVRARLRLEGVCTHLSSADDADHTVTREQLNRFEAALRPVRRRFPKAVVHAANSAAALAHPRSRYDLVRIGLAMYGLYPHRRFSGLVALTPAMRLVSRVVRAVTAPSGTAVSYGATYRVLRPATIATIACGYADGYPRLAGLNGEVALDGTRVHIAGRVCMDYLMVDAGQRSIQVGDVAELFGRTVSVDEVAAWAHTVAYEVLCGVGARVPRVYLRGGLPVAVERT